jgi:hypothetical protein
MSCHKIIYQKGISSFKIIPKLNDDMECKFIEYINHLKQNSFKLSNGISTFFWKYNSHTSSIDTNDDVESISVDFKDQLVKIISWLYNQGYTVEGSFCFRSYDAIEAIEVTINNKMIRNYILVENLNIWDTVHNDYVDDLPLDTKIMIHDKENIYSHLREINSNELTQSLTIPDAIKKEKIIKNDSNVTVNVSCNNIQRHPRKKSSRPVRNNQNENFSYGSIAAIGGFFTMCFYYVYKFFTTNV